MTANEYIDPKRFPRTTQAGLSVKGQLMIDSFNHDAINEMIENDEVMDEDQQARYAELEEKMRFRAALLAEIVAEEKRAKDQPLSM